MSVDTRECKCRVTSLESQTFIVLAVNLYDLSDLGGNDPFIAVYAHAAGIYIHVERRLFPEGYWVTAQNFSVKFRTDDLRQAQQILQIKGESATDITWHDTSLFTSGHT